MIRNRLGQDVSQTCPQCGSKQIRQLGTGTEKVEQLVREQFPTARTLRWDAETTRKKGAHELILNHFRRVFPPWLPRL